MENRVFECINVQKDNTKRDSTRNIKPNILSPISTKKEAIYLSNYHNYRGKNYVKNHNNNNIIIDNRPFDSSRKTSSSSVVAKDEKENLIKKQEDRSTNNLRSAKQQGILQTLLSFDEKNNEENLLKRKIPRPANAFMLFANEWRKKLASENPRESNKDISVRLGILWKNISKDVKEKYFTLAREVDAEHKKKYPDYVYNPKEARIRKAMREQSRESSRRSIVQSAIGNPQKNPLVSSTSTTTTSTTTTTTTTTTTVTATTTSTTTTTTTTTTITTTTTTSTSSLTAEEFLNQPQQRDHLDCGPSGLNNYQTVHFIDPPRQQQHQHVDPDRPMMPESWCPTINNPHSKCGYNDRGPEWYAGGVNEVNVDQRSRLAMQQHQLLLQQQQQQQQLQQRQQQQQQQQQFLLGKQPIDVISYRAAAAAATVAAAANLEREIRRQQMLASYQLTEFPERQKWSPYQNASHTHHQHARTIQLPTPPQIAIPYTGRQETTAQGGSWGHFSHNLPTYVPGVIRNVTMHGIRQAIFLRDNTSNRQDFAENQSQIPYFSRKRELGDNREPSYPTTENQIPVETSTSAGVIPPRKCEIIKEMKWQTNPVSSPRIFNGLLIPATMTSKRPRDQEKDYDRNSSESFESKKPNLTQPLPGFHQAFGSTEIGKFSRSEYFANMVGDKSNEIEEDNKKDDIPERYLSVPRMFPFPMACQNIFKTPDVIDETTKKPNELYSRTVHDGYYWFAKQAGNSIARFSNGNTICTRPPKCIHHANEEQEFQKNATVASLSNIETILRRYNGKCCILINEEDDHVEDQKYILIDTDNSDDGSSYVEEDEDDNDNIKVNENKSSYSYKNNRKEFSPKSFKE